jgi:hypothetical protein
MGIVLDPNPALRDLQKDPDPVLDLTLNTGINLTMPTNLNIFSWLHTATFQRKCRSMYRILNVIVIKLSTF